MTKKTKTIKPPITIPNVAEKFYFSITDKTTSSICRITPQENLITYNLEWKGEWEIKVVTLGWLGNHYNKEQLLTLHYKLLQLPSCGVSTSDFVTLNTWYQKVFGKVAGNELFNDLSLSVCMHVSNADDYALVMCNAMRLTRMKIKEQANTSLNGLINYLFKRLKPTTNGYHLSKTLADKWKKRAETPIEQLTLEELKTSEIEAEKYMKIIESLIK